MTGGTPQRLLLASAAFACASCALVANLGDRTLGDVDGAAAGDGGDGAAPDGASGDSALPLDDASAGEGATESAPPDQRIDPLEIGRTWTYEVTPVDGGVSPCAPGPESAAVTGPGAPIDGSSTARYQSLCASYQVDVIVNGDTVTAYSFDGHFAGPITLVEAPVEEGHSWNGGGITYVWHDAGAVTVPAGTFPACWAREFAGGQPGQFVYCRGVGLTRVENTGYVAVLTKKNF